MPDTRPVRPSALAEGIFRREIVPWGLLGLALGLVEGATAAVLVKQHFSGVAPPFAVNLAVALVSGAPAFSNVLSFVWANVAHGRARVQLIVALQAAFALLVGCVSFASRAAGGLVVTVLSVIAARVLWAGILTVRAAVWSANYPRNVLARITGRLVIVNSIAVACSAALVGWALEAHAVDARWLYGGGALAGLLGAWLYRAMRVRREFRLLAEEAASGARSEPFSLRMLTRILKDDPTYREYMLWMGVFGGGTLMLTAQLVLLFSERLRLSSGTQIGMLAVVPLITQPVFLPWWARLFDGSHIVRYRSRQGWAIVLASAAMCAGVFSAWLPLLWLGAVLLGAAQAGANLGWNLGHNDFASIGRAQHYMGVHVTLTGLRGGVAPPIGVLAYMGLEASHPGAGEFALLLPLAMTLTGALGFNRMRRRAEAQEAAARVAG
ncbi:MAG TPA: MFS transporter [Steroidobacteraceae bacterium]|nr:MFS transporter [Steroidobacteraceae bacterium]